MTIGPVAPPSGGPAEDLAAWGPSWEAALTSLELEVDAAERLLDQLHTQAEHVPPPPVAPWTPPAGLGPLPQPLAQRARALVARQLDVADEIAGAIVLNRRQARTAQVVAQSLPQQRNLPAQAVFLDVAL